MKFFLIVILSSILLSCDSNARNPASTNMSLADAKDCSHDEKTFRCVKYLRNYDADTITVDIPNVHPLIGNKISVRVLHIDAAEIKGKQPCEKEAARSARKLVENLLKNAKRIDLENVQKDKYFRILADVRADGILIRDVLIKNNLAYDYEGKTKEKINWCRRLPANL